MKNNERRIRSFPEGRCRSCAGFSSERHTEWLVTSAQEQPRISPERGPWGTVHARRNGSLVTACGIYAVAWPVFWGRSLGQSSDESCPTCLRSVYAKPLHELIAKCDAKNPRSHVPELVEMDR